MQWILYDHAMMLSMLCKKIEPIIFGLSISYWATYNLSFHAEPAEANSKQHLCYIEAANIWDPTLPAFPDD